MSIGKPHTHPQIPFSWVLGCRLEGRKFPECAFLQGRPSPTDTRGQEEMSGSPRPADLTFPVSRVLAETGASTNTTSSSRASSGEPALQERPNLLFIY